LLADADAPWRAAPLLADGSHEGEGREVRSPADRRDVVGFVVEATPDQAAAALTHAVAAASTWQATPPTQRAARLLRAADLLESRLQPLLGLIVREAGRSLPDAISEVREAVDFLRYYAAEARERFSNDTHIPLGPVVCISPWNFPLAIFTGQVAAALAAGNPVIAKPAEETPLIAMQAVHILHEAGVPAGAVQFLPGGGEIGAALVADPRTRGVMFTGSTEVARHIQAELATRLGPDGWPILLIAETGGQNALIVDSSALAEQVVGDVLASAFDSAGQRCSALRVLCIQDDVAGRVLGILKGAMAELTIGNPDRLSTDVGPVITDESRRNILAHVEAMRGKGRAVHGLKLPTACGHGTFVAPTLIEIESIGELEQEVFGPVLHVLRYRRDELDRLIDAINGTGYALTFGVHSRIDETIAQAIERVEAGNIYVNRNLIGAVVGVQPFGGHRLSGTGPKAGGPLYLRRLLSRCPELAALRGGMPSRQSRVWCDWVRAQGWSEAAERCACFVRDSPLGATLELRGPVGERNVYELRPHGAVLCLAETESGLLAGIGAALATGNRVIVAAQSRIASTLADVPAALQKSIKLSDNPQQGDISVALFDGSSEGLIALNRQLAARPGPIVPVHRIDSEPLLERLLRERSISTNTAAAGGNASLMTIG
ncbi:MAG: L-glutamate gamma-semialdehyde dehydrogenase, partial [Acetobacteraceae bacterium]|nr:L-glutamate gamma-semialdehyde dehydrogenase [Acetobacteraceae bacterium]